MSYNAINLMKPFMDNNFDPNRLKSKIDILEMADKVDSHIAYRTQTDFMVKKRNMITNLIIKIILFGASINNSSFFKAII